MRIGINYPWIDYGWDFGDPPGAWISPENQPAWREIKRRRIEEDFRQFAAQGIFAVRWFLLSDGLNYGIGESAPRKESQGWKFEPLPSGHPFYSRLRDDFEFVLSVCRNNGLQLFPSLIDYSWCGQGRPVPGHPGIVKGGRDNVVRDPRKRQAFFERVLDPLLDSSLQYRDSVYAWEIINEPEWVVRGLFKRGPDRTVARREMRAFIAEGIRRIRENTAFRASVGFAHWETLDKWRSDRLGITLRQFHYYAQKNRTLPAEMHEADRRCIIGEFATAVGRVWPDLIEEKKDQTLSNRLLCIESKRYPACFLWSANAKDSATRWNEEAQQEVLAYNRLSGENGIRG
jgi:hypothetical protein